MRPTLFRVFGWPVPSYAAFMVLGFLAALGVIWLLAGRNSAGRAEDAQGARGGLDRPQAWDLFLVMVISAVMGSKVGHVLFEAPGHIARDGHRIESLPELLYEEPLHWLALGDPGYVWYGGMLACLGVAVIYFRRRPRLNAWLFSDAFAPAIMVGAAVGRTGCFFAGCCYGRPTESFVGVQFPQLPGPVHPTQLYDASLALILGTGLLWRFGRRRFDGESIAILLMAYPVLRSLTEAFRGDPERGFAWGLSTSQWISIPLFFIGLTIYLVRWKQSRSDGAPAPGRMASEPQPR